MYGICGKAVRQCERNKLLVPAREIFDNIQGKPNGERCTSPSADRVVSSALI
jgi:hypothetical protein